MAGQVRQITAPDSAFTGAVRRLIRAVEATFPPGFSGTVRCHVVGVCAIHLYTGYRASEGLDVLFRPGLVLADTPVATYTDESGRTSAVVLDRNYTDVLAVMHTDWIEDCWAWEQFGRVEAVVIAPVDLAVSKVARFADSDRLDIAHLAGAEEPLPRTRSAVLGEDLPANNGRTDYLRAIEHNGHVYAASLQDSSMLLTLARSTCLVVRTADAPAASAGDSAEVLDIA